METMAIEKNIHNRINYRANLLNKYKPFGGFRSRFTLFSVSFSVSNGQPLYDELRLYKEIRPRNNRRLYYN